MAAPSIAAIQEAVAGHFGLVPADLRSDLRAVRIARPRQIAMYLARLLTSRSYPEIARAFGGRDHTTAIHAARHVAQLRQIDPATDVSVRACAASFAAPAAAPEGEGPMPAPKAPLWTQDEIAALQRIYPIDGLQGAAAALAGRSWLAIQVKASSLGIRSGTVPAAPIAKLAGHDLERAISMREDDGWSFARIGAEFGISESAANNAIVAALCTRKGYRPAERDAHGRLLPEGLERLRYALRKGYRAAEIQLRLGLSASRIAEERRRYNRELLARGKAPLPPAGGGEAYSGAKLSRDAIAEVEALLNAGLGSEKISLRTGVSKTSVGRIRKRMVARMARKGECLTGCDRDGARRKQAENTRFIAEDQKRALREKLLAGMPVQRAARLCGIGQSSAYTIRNDLKLELEARGEELPKPKLPGRISPAQSQARAAEGIPADKLMRFRALVRDHGEAEARALLAREIKAERARPLTFEEQLERVRSGAATVVPKFVPTKAAPDITLGGVASGAL